MAIRPDPGTPFDWARHFAQPGGDRPCGESASESVALADLLLAGAHRSDFNMPLHLAPVLVDYGCPVIVVESLLRIGATALPMPSPVTMTEVNLAALQLTFHPGADPTMSGFWSFRIHERVQVAAQEMASRMGLPDPLPDALTVTRMLTAWANYDQAAARHLLAAVPVTSVLSTMSRLAMLVSMVQEAQHE